jgi:hypothetical protein
MDVDEVIPESRFPSLQWLPGPPATVDISTPWILDADEGHPTAAKVVRTTL